MVKNLLWFSLHDYNKKRIFFSVCDWLLTLLANENKNISLYKYFYLSWHPVQTTMHMYVQSKCKIKKMKNRNKAVDTYYQQSSLFSCKILKIAKQPSSDKAIFSPK